MHLWKGVIMLARELMLIYNADLLVFLECTFFSFNQCYLL